MRIPRWTTYLAIAMILLIAVIAIPTRQSGRGAARQAQTESTAQSIGSTSSGSSVGPGFSGDLHLADFLPVGYVTNGSVDYRAELQYAIDSSSGRRLILPGFPIRVGRAPGANYGVLLNSGLTLIGTSQSVLLTSQLGLQLLRGEGVIDVSLRGFAMRGPGGDGYAQGHGLLQITGGENIRIEDLTIRGADSDGMAFSQVKDLSVRNSSVIEASKSAIYLASCTVAIVESNRIRNFGGHLLANGKKVGVGIQLSSNRDVICRGNSISTGLGIGILCNAFVGGDKPEGNLINANIIQDVRNVEYLSSSCGIRLTNGNADKQTDTLVTSNRVLRCGMNGIYVENHGGSSVTGNLVTDSDRDGILVSSIDGVFVADNLVLRSGVFGNGNSTAIQLWNNANRVTTRGNWDGAGAGMALAVDHSRGFNSLEQRVQHLPRPPIDGQWDQGDLAYNSAPATGEPVGWVCISAGAPGVWAVFGRVE